MTEQAQEQEEAPRGGCISTGLKMFASIGGLITVVSIFNVAFDLDLEITVYGTGTALPTDWMAVIAIAVVCLIAYGIATIMTNAWVGKQFRERPWLKWATPVVITLLLSVGFYALYYSIEYAGPLHYAARSNDIETVKEELQEDVDAYDFHRAIWECIKLDHSEILILLLEKSYKKEEMKGDFSYALDVGSMDVLNAFIDAGVGYEGEDGDFLAEFLAVSELSKKEKTEVGLNLLEEGADPDGLYTGGWDKTDLTALEQAKEQGLTDLVEAMEAN